MLAPPVRLVTVHAAEELQKLWSLQGKLHFGREIEGFLQGPLGGHAGVHHQVMLNAAAGLHAVVVGQGFGPQPVAEGGAVTGSEQLFQGVLAAGWRASVIDGKEMQIMIAQHDLHGVIDVLQEAKGIEGLGPAIDQVAHTPQFVMSRPEADLFQQLHQRLVAPLNIADGIDRHA